MGTIGPEEQFIRARCAREAFDDVLEAARLVDAYKASKDHTLLVKAQKFLSSALIVDQGSYDALFYDGVVSDLVGHPAIAVERFRKLLTARTGRSAEVLYNLGLAYYHQYSRDKLDQAIVHFREAGNATDDPIMKLLCSAALAQTYAMRMIPPLMGPVDQHGIESDFKSSRSEAKRVTGRAAGLWLRLLAWRQSKKWRATGGERLAPALRSQLRWAAYNAFGMALMYRSDYLPGDNHEKLKQLTKARKVLEKAEKLNPRDWANWCDLGSCHMRIAHWSVGEARATNFAEARRYLDEVLNKLHPNYGFARYERARVDRLDGHFDNAIGGFKEALQIPVEERAVSDARIELELQLAAAGSNAYPVPVRE